jgi:hypothetical protein
MKLLLVATMLGLLPSINSVVLRRLPVATTAPAHTPVPDSTTVRLLYGAESPELDEVLGRVLRIEKHRLVLNDRRLAGRRLHITFQEYQHGVASPEKELTQDASLTKLDSAGRFEFTIYAHPFSEAKVENQFVLPRAITPKAFTAMPNQANNYSLRFDIHRLHRCADQTGKTASNPVKEFRLPIGPSALLAVYTLPYEKEGMFYYCNLAQSRVPVADWYARFKVPHFVVYRVRIV